MMKNYFVFTFISAFLFAVTLMGTNCFAYDNNSDVVIANFESDSYQDWTVTGNAFGNKPAQGTLPGQHEVPNFEGKGLVNSYLGMDPATGTLTSPEFTIKRKYINFLIGGGYHPSETCMNLSIDGDRIVRTATGNNSERLEWSSWDVSDLIGKKAVLEIVDSVTGGWGHINVDSIFQSDENIVVSFEKEMVFAKKYLNFPIKGGPRRTIDIFVDGKKVREFDVELAPQNPDFWVYMDISEFKDKKGKISTSVGGRKKEQLVLDRICQSDHPQTVTLMTTADIAYSNNNDIVIANFESDNYQGWAATGDAFGAGPVQGAFPTQQEVSGFEGKSLVNSFLGLDVSTGTLVSPEFTIKRKYINFLIGGGYHPSEICMNLSIDGDRIVRTATGNNSERLEWSSWDVSDLIGKKAVLEIVDSATGGWGHINVDSISQSDESVVENVEKEMVFTKKYLNFPVKTGAAKGVIDIIVDGKKVREFDIELAPPNPDFWVYMDVSDFEGKKAKLSTRITGRVKDRSILDCVYESARPKEANSFYKEKSRQQIHFSPKRGWCNDTNGMVYYDGEYHLFWQHNPFGWSWGNMTWGHAVSKDMIHWKELDSAIYPDEMGTIFSGSAVVDQNNTSGFQTGKEKPIVCFYTSAGGCNEWSKEAGAQYTQSMAYSNDRGRTWTKYAGNPVVKHIEIENRDPKVFWHEPTKQWVMALYLRNKVMQFLTSKDLKQWKKQSTLKSFDECPELFELPIDGNENNKKWVHYGGYGVYFVGDFDGKTFIPDGEEKQFNYGNCFYASQTFNNMPDKRRVQMGWGQIVTEKMPFNQCILFPVELKLRSTDAGILMTAMPIQEVRLLHRKKHSFKNFVVNGREEIKSLKGELFHIIAEFDASTAKEFCFDIRGKKVIYNTQDNILSCVDKQAPLKPDSKGNIQLELLVDRNSIEIFANDGVIYMPIGGVLDENNRNIAIISEGGKYDQLDIYELDSIWKK